MTEERKKFYIECIKNSTSFAEVCRKANIGLTNGNYTTLKNLVYNENIDITHFKRQNNQIRASKIDINDVFTNKRAINSFRLKNLLLKYRYKEHKCENPECGLTEWHGKPIPLELHHINGNPNDNRLENLQLLCPNCHSQTDNYCAKNIKGNTRNYSERYCKVCGNKLEPHQKLYCSTDCENKRKEKEHISIKDSVYQIINSKHITSIRDVAKKLKISRDRIKHSLIYCKCYDEVLSILKENREKYKSVRNKIYISKEELIDLMSKYSFLQIGRIYNVTDTAIRKWCKKYNLPYRRREITTFLKENVIEDKREKWML